MRTPPNYYASQPEGSGFTMWRFASRAERDEWVEQNSRRRPVEARQVEAAFSAPGVFWRWGKPEFIRPVA